MTDRKRLHEALDRLLDEKTPFSLQLAVLCPDRRISLSHYGQGFPPSLQVGVHLHALRQYCSSAATPATLAMIPELEEDIRQLENFVKPETIVSMRAGNA